MALIELVWDASVGGDTVDTVAELFGGPDEEAL